LVPVTKAVRNGPAGTDHGFDYPLSRVFDKKKSPAGTDSSRLQKQRHANFTSGREL